MSAVYLYAIIIAIFAALIVKIIVDFRSINRLSRINKKNKKLDSICIVTQYQDSIDDLINQIRLLKIRKNKLITIGILIREKIDRKTKKNILSEIQNITKNKIIFIEFKNIRGITAAIKNNCDSELVILLNNTSRLSQDFVRRIIKISSRYADQAVFVPYAYQKIGNSLGSLISVRLDIFSKFYHQIFGLKTSFKQIQPGYIYRVKELQKNIVVRVPIESACFIQENLRDSGILHVMNSQIKLLSASKKFKILFGTIGALVVVILLADKFYIANLFVIVIIFVITFYAIMGIISQFGNKKYSVYENMCLLLILPIYIAIAGIEYLFAILELFQKRICKNNKRN